MAIAPTSSLRRIWWVSEFRFGSGIWLPPEQIDAVYSNILDSFLKTLDFACAARKIKGFQKTVRTKE
jgi:hypothetical protein